LWARARAPAADDGSGRSHLRDGAVAFGAALAATLVEGVGRFAWSGPYLPELMAQKLFALLPPWAFTPLLRSFGHNAKYHAFAGMVVLEVGALTVFGAVLRGWARRGPGSPGIRVATATATLGLVLMLIGLPLLDVGVLGGQLPGGSWIAIPTLVVVIGSYAALLTRGL
jgi:hypothetical protein